MLSCVWQCIYYQKYGGYVFFLIDESERVRNGIGLLIFLYYSLYVDLLVKDSYKVILFYKMKNYREYVYEVFFVVYLGNINLEYEYEVCRFGFGIWFSELLVDFFQIYDVLVCEW